MITDSQTPNGPYDPQPQPAAPDVAPVSPGQTPQEVPIRDPLGVPAIDPGRAPDPGYDPGPGPASPQSPTIPMDPQPRS